MEYKVGQCVNHIKFGSAVIIKIVDEYEVHIKFKLTSFIWVCAEDDLTQGRFKDLVQVANESRKLDTYRKERQEKHDYFLSNSFDTTKSGKIKPLEYVGESRYLVEFLNTGNTKDVFSTSILSGKVKDVEYFESLKTNNPVRKDLSLPVIGMRFIQDDGVSLIVKDVNLDTFVANVVKDGDESSYEHLIPLSAVKAGLVDTRTMTVLPPKYSKKYVGVVGEKGSFQISSKSEAYKTWIGLLSRCHSPVSLRMSRNKSYIHTTVCKDWLLLENFYGWFNKHYEKGKHLDKDLKSKEGLPTYSPETCLFVSPTLNSILVVDKYSEHRHEYLGVKVNENGTFYSHYKEYASGLKIEKAFYTAEDAHRFWQEAKLQFFENYLGSDKLDASDKAILQMVIENLQSDISNDQITKKFRY